MSTESKSKTTNWHSEVRSRNVRLRQQHPFHVEGRAAYTMEPSHFEQVPPRLSRRSPNRRRVNNLWPNPHPHPLKAFDHRLLDRAATEIAETASAPVPSSPADSAPHQDRALHGQPFPHVDKRAWTSSKCAPTSALDIIQPTAKTVDELKKLNLRPVSHQDQSLINVNFTITFPHEHWNFRSKVGMTASMTRPDHHACHRHSRRTELDSQSDKDNDGYTAVSSASSIKRSIASPAAARPFQAAGCAPKKSSRITRRRREQARRSDHRYGLQGRTTR